MGERIGDGAIGTAAGQALAALAAACLVASAFAAGCATGRSRPTLAGPPRAARAAAPPAASPVALGAVAGAPAGPLRPGSALYPLAEPFLPQVLEASTRQGVDARLILGVIMVESGFDPRARSPRGARGLMQLLPETARRFGARAPDDPSQNIDAGTRYLRYLLDLFRGDVDRALAGYNAGEMAVVRAGGVPPTPSVRRFVLEVEARSRQF